MSQSTKRLSPDQKQGAVEFMEDQRLLMQTAQLLGEAQEVQRTVHGDGDLDKDSIIGRASYTTSSNGSYGVRRHKRNTPVDFDSFSRQTSAPSVVIRNRSPSDTKPLLLFGIDMQNADVSFADPFADEGDIDPQDIGLYHERTIDMYAGNNELQSAVTQNHHMKALYWWTTIDYRNLRGSVAMIKEYPKDRNKEACLMFGVRPNKAQSRSIYYALEPVVWFPPEEELDAQKPFRIYPDIYIGENNSTGYLLSVTDNEPLSLPSTHVMHTQDEKENMTQVTAATTTTATAVEPQNHKSNDRLHKKQSVRVQERNTASTSIMDHVTVLVGSSALPFLNKQQSYLSPDKRMPKTGLNQATEKMTIEQLESAIFTPVQLKYVQIPIEDLSARVMYLKQHAELLSQETVISFQKLLMDQAVQFTVDKRIKHAKQCILSSSLIQLCRKSDPSHLGQIRAQLQYPDSLERSELNRFYQALAARSSKEAKKRLAGDNIPPIDGPVASVENVKDTSMPPLSSPKPISQRNNPPRSKSSHNTNRHKQLRSSSLHHLQDLRTRDGSVSSQSALESLSELTKHFPEIKRTASQAVHPSKSPDEQIRNLFSMYKNQDGKRFFTLGRVFAVLWHEPLGKDKNQDLDTLHERLDITLGPLGGSILNQVRRMIVVRNRRGYCWCVSMGTYGGHGLVKQNFSRDVINAHAIVYDARDKQLPKSLPGEPYMEKRAIAVDLVPGAQILPATRVDCGKPFNVNWNVEVMNMGMVAKADQVVLEGYAKEELFR